MKPSSPKEVTQLLLDWTDGDKMALDKLIPLVEAELRRRARNYMRGERVNHTLQPTALINEAYLRLIDYTSIRWQDRVHFFAVCADLMRRILVEHARRRLAAKRGGLVKVVGLDDESAVSQQKDIELLALDEALAKLEVIDPRRAQIVKLRFLGGLKNEEIAEELGVATDTIRRQWNSAKAWLHHEITRGSDEQSRT